MLTVHILIAKDIRDIYMCCIDMLPSSIVLLGNAIVSDCQATWWCALSGVVQIGGGGA